MKYIFTEKYFLADAVQQNLWHPQSYKEKTFVGEVPTEDVIFDWTNRKFVNTAIFEKLN